MYTLQSIQEILARLVPVARELDGASGEASTRSEHAKTIRGVARNLVAQAVATAHMIGLGPALIRALLRDTVPSAKRLTVNVSECFRVMTQHADADRIAEKWASGTFEPTVGEALSACKPAKDLLANLTKAVRAALDAGETPEDIQTAVSLALAEVQQEQEQSEQETEVEVPQDA